MSATNLMPVDGGTLDPFVALQFATASSLPLSAETSGSKKGGTILNSLIRSLAPDAGSVGSCEVVSGPRYRADSALTQCN